MRTDPSITKRLITKYEREWQDLKDSVKVIKITCQDSRVAKVAEEIRALGLENAEDYIRPVTDKSHGAKFDIIVKITNRSQYAAKLFFLTLNTYKQEPGEAQIANRYVFNRMIQEGKLPRLNSDREESATT